METNGTRDPDGGAVLDRVDHLCVSPKRGGVLERLRAHELKVVVPGVLPCDLARHRPWDAEDLRDLERRGSWGQCFVQPMDVGAPARDAQDAIAFVRALPGWRLSVQSHKWLGLR
jgi:organic radical activating enzyme